MDVCAWNPPSSLFVPSLCYSITGPETASEGLIDWPRSEVASINRYEDAWEDLHDCVDEFCIFVNKGFDGQGIAAVTTPENYYRMARLSGSGSNGSGIDRYRLAESPGKGRGLFARRAIQRGEQVMSTRPAILVHQRMANELDLEDVYDLLDTAVESLPLKRKESYMEQVGHMGGHKTADILFTNAYQLSLGKDDSFHYGSFPDASMINHDCRPNLAFYVDQNLTFTAHAARNIEKGEELTVSYLDPFQLRNLRQERAKNTLGFSCTCSQCSLPKKEADASDARLLSITDIEGQLSDFNSQTSSPAMIEELMLLYRQEHLESKLSGAYTLAALNYNLFGKKRMAQQYAELAVEAGTLENGHDSTDISVMRELAGNPKGHWSWNKKGSS